MNCEDLFTVNKKSITYVFKNIVEQRQFFKPTTKEVLVELVKLDMVDIPFEGNILDRNKLIEETVDELIKEYQLAKKIEILTEEGLEPTPEYPEITSVTVSAKSGLKELNDNVKAGSIVGFVQVVGGTKPYKITFNGGKDDSKFELVDGSIKTKEALVKGEYKVNVKVVDFGNKSKESTGTITVAEQDYPEIESISVSITPNLTELTDNTKEGAEVATLSVVGGTEPYIFSLEAGDENFSLSENKVTFKKTLEAGSYELSVKVTDDKGKTLTKNLSIIISELKVPELEIRKVSNDADLFGKHANELADITVSGLEVSGKLYYIEGYTEFSTNPEEQNGNYLPLYFPQISEMDSIKVEITDSIGTRQTTLTEDGLLVARIREDKPQEIKVIRIYNGKENTMAIKINLIIEPPAPEIDSVNITINENLVEKTDETKAGSVIGTIAITGGTQPYTSELEEGSDKFEISDNQIKCKEDLAKGEYSIKVKVTDAKKKEKSASATITILEKQVVEPAGPQETIGSVTVSELQSDIEVSEEHIISGELKYKENLEEWTKDGNKSGNFLVLNIEEGTVESTCDNINVPETTKYIFKVTKPETDTVTVTIPQAMAVSRKARARVMAAQGETVTYTMTGLKLEKKSIEVVVSEPGAEEDLFGKHVTDLQKDVTGFDTKKLTGTSKYIRNYEGIPVEEDREGNFLALHFEQAGQGYTVKAGFEGGKETTLDTDGNYVVKLKEKKPIKVTVENETTKGEATIDISGIELEPAWTIYDISEIFSARDQEANTFNKKVKDLQVNNIQLQNTGSGIGKATGTIKWVNDYQTGGDTEGNFIALHVDNTKLPKGEIKFAFDKTEGDPDKNDWNVNLRIDNKTDKNFKIKVDGEVVYTLNLEEATLLNKPEDVLKVLAADHSMGNKKVSDLQSDVTISKDKLTGTSKWIKGLTLTQGDKDPANYLALHIEKSKLPSENVKLGINNLTDVDKKDWDVLLKITEESIQKPLRIEVDGNVVYNFDLKDVKLVREILSARDQNADTFDKKVSDLQDSDVTVKEIDSTKGEAEGTLKYVTGWGNPDISEGNVIALHIDNTKLPDGTVKIGIGDKFVDPDTKDWNVNLRLDNKEDREFKIKVDDNVVYTLDLTKVKLTPKAE